LDETGICVVIAARHAERTIGMAVRSALAQAHVHEVIVVDDASRDATAAAARSADDGTGRLSVLVEPRNLGPAGARNRALARSRSAYFCVLDADDYMLPGRLAELMAQAPGDWDLLADDIIILPHDAPAGFALRRDIVQPHQTLTLERFVLGNISRPGRPRGELGFLKPVVSRDFMRRHQLLYDENIRLGEDYAFYVRALMRGARFRIVSACGYVAVERPDSLSARHSAADLEQMMLFDRDILASSEPLSDDGRAALEAHRAALWRKTTYAAALEAKRAHGLAAGLALLAGSPAVLPYVAAETVRAKSSVLRARLGGDGGDRRELRLLMGLPGARLDVRSQSPQPSADFVALNKAPLT
jgi:succinoglycan biosynthesis protein ExoU